MKNQKYLFMLALCALYFAILISPVIAESYPSPVGYVNDFAGVLNVSQRLTLVSMLAELERNTTAEIAVVTVDSAPDDFTYAVGLFQAWEIGKESNDNGVLVLYAKEQNKIRVITGYGVEGILPDGKVGRILDESYVPLRDANQTADGIVAATQKIADVIYENADEVRAGRDVEMLPVFLAIAFFVIIFVIIFAIAYAATRMSRPKCPVDNIRMKKVRVERISTGIIGYVEIIHYKCPICGRMKTVKKSGSRVAFFPVIIGGGVGGFGGFGGGGTGGGGAGR